VRRLLPTLAVAALGAAAVVIPEPVAPPPPLSGVVIERLGISSPTDATIWYCPWAQATTTRDSAISLVAGGPATANLTLPVLIPGEPPDRASAAIDGPDGVVITLSDVAQRGDSPGFVEFDGGPSGVSVVVSGEVLAADACVGQAGDEWFFVGGSTMTGEALRLRLFNPFPEAAKVSVSAFSEIGTEVLGSMSSVTISSRSWVDLDFAEQLRQRQSLIVSVRLDSGLAVPAMAFTHGADEAWWSGTGLGTAWELPIGRLSAEDSAAIVVANPSLSDVTVDIELFGTEGAQRTQLTLDIPAQAPGRLDLSTLEIDFDIVAARVSSPTPVAVGVVSTGASGTAVTSGVEQQSGTWLLPGTRPETGRSVSLWLLNTSDNAVVVTVSRFTGDEVFNVNEILEPGTVTEIPVVGDDTVGYMVRSADPFSAAWSVTADGRVAFSAGIPVPPDD
jgi:hypothetical protein